MKAATASGSSRATSYSKSSQRMISPSLGGPAVLDSDPLSSLVEPVLVVLVLAVELDDPPESPGVGPASLLPPVDDASPLEAAGSVEHATSRAAQMQ